MSEAASAELAKAKPDPVSQPVADAGATNGRVAELRAAAHLMTLDSGLFCVFPAPNSPPPDPVTGLPGVRVTPAPGMAGRPEAVNVSTFREDGWLNGTAALVRVTDGSAQILVTVYQDSRQGPDMAPRLQVLRLSGEPNGAVAEPSLAAAPMETGSRQPGTPNPEIMAHVQRMGDVGGRIGDWIGVKGSRKWLEGFGLAPTGGILFEDIEYQGVLGRNWLSPWVAGGKFCGSRGMALPLLGFKVRLKGSAAKAFDCSYSATFVDGSAVGPVSVNEACEAASLAPLEAFQIMITPRAAKQESAKRGSVKEADPKETEAKKPAGKKTPPTLKPKPAAAAAKR